MAELLIRTVNNGSDPMSWRDGDVVCVMPDGHTWGRMESLEVWEAEGNDPAKWPGGFAIIRIPGEPVERFSHLLDGARDRTALQFRRLRSVNYMATERRPESVDDKGKRRDTLRAYMHITRPGLDVDDVASEKDGLEPWHR